MLRATDPASVVEHGTWARDIDPGRPWGSGPVTLVGDAAHPIRPVTGAANRPGIATCTAWALAQTQQAHGRWPMEAETDSWLLSWPSHARRRMDVGPHAAAGQLIRHSASCTAL